MWKLPDGKVIRYPKQISVGDVNHPKQIFKVWSRAELNAIGVYPYREQTYNKQFYKSTGTVEVEQDGEIVCQHTLVRRYTNPELRALFTKRVKKHLLTLWRSANEELDYLEQFEPDNTTDINLWVDYKANLKLAVPEIRAAMQAISSYAEAIEFIQDGYHSMLPVVPLQEETA